MRAHEAMPEAVAAALRRTMVDCQIRTFDVTDLGVIAAFDVVPRERFVPPARVAVAYGDGPIALGDGEAMLPPMVLARLVQALDVRPGERALVVGDASGYAAAILAVLGAVAAGEGAIDILLVQGGFEVLPADLLARLSEAGRCVGIDRSGGTGHAVRIDRSGSALGTRRLFDATAPVLPAMRRAPGFEFA